MSEADFGQARDDATLVATLRKRVRELERDILGLEVNYKQAGNNLERRVADDIAFIGDAREEARKLTQALRGVELFGRYSHDADHHFRVANRWRVGAIAVLLVAPAVVVVMVTQFQLSGVALMMGLTPLLGLFIYASIESHNHRRREFDRRRIALRVSAIEGFTKRRREGTDPKARELAEGLLDEFVRKHFIEPNLDSNDMDYLAPRFSLFTVLGRDAGKTSKHDGQERIV